jgi:hypothetical protein
LIPIRYKVTVQKLHACFALGNIIEATRLFGAHSVHTIND